MGYIQEARSFYQSFGNKSVILCEFDRDKHGRHYVHVTFDGCEAVHIHELHTINTDLVSIYSSADADMKTCLGMYNVENSVVFPHKQHIQHPVFYNTLTNGKCILTFMLDWDVKKNVKNLNDKIYMRIVYGKVK